jgi:hypothetical protein
VLAQICFKKRQILGGVGRILHSIEINVKQRCFRVDSLTFLFDIAVMAQLLQLRMERYGVH